MPILAAKADMIKHRIYFYMLIYMGEKNEQFRTWTHRIRCLKTFVEFL